MPIPGGPYNAPPVAPIPPADGAAHPAAVAAGGPARPAGAGLGALLSYLGAPGGLANSVRARRRAQYGEIPGWSTPYQSGQQAARAAGVGGVSAPAGAPAGGTSAGGGLGALLAFLSRFS